MDEKCDKLLDEMLDEVADAFHKTRVSYLKNGNVAAYIARLGKLTNILMSVKTGLALSNQPMFSTVPEFSKEELI